MGILESIIHFWCKLSGRYRVVKLLIEPHQGDRAFVSSPDLQGFTLVLGPGECRTIKSMMDAIYPALTEFLRAEDLAAKKPSRKAVEVTGLRRSLWATEPMALLADVAYP
jgi:hypothetical protein